MRSSMRARFSKGRRVALVGLAVLVLAADRPACSDADGVAPIELNPGAVKPPGPDGDGSWILINGRRIRPLGTLTEVDHHPLGLVLSPDGSTVFSISNGERQHAVTALDASSGAVLSTADRARLFLGLAVSSDGRRVYAGGGEVTGVVVYDWDGAKLSETTDYALDGFHGGLALSPDDRRIYAVDQIDGGLSILDAATGDVLGAVATRANAYGVVVSPDGRTAYVSEERSDTVAFIDVTDPANPSIAKRIKVPKNPEGLALSADGSRLYVASADADSVSTIDTDRGRVIRSMDLRTLNVHGYGSGPNSLAFSPDGSRLYIAQATDNKVAVLDLERNRLIGAMPTAWYPVAIAVSPDGGRLYVANMKGLGAGPDGVPGSLGLRNRPAIQFLDIPGDPELAQWSTTIDQMNTRSARLYSVSGAPSSNPIPLVRGGPSPIEHVIILVRENKTFDALFGDWDRGEADPAFCSYCEITPNIRALAERFASGDNYYSNAESSDQGHMILTTGISNTYHEKVRNTDGRPFSNLLDVFANPTAMPKKEAIFQAMVKAGIEFRNYGEAVGMLKDLLILKPEFANWKAVDPPFNWLFSDDVDKLASRVEEWERDGLPAVTFMLFPNDHGLGCTPPFPTPRSMVADNDLATGQFVHWLSRSPYWEKSLVLIVQDDPQGSDDHVDAHRSILVVVSPWVKRGYLSNVLYHEGNLLATLEHLVGLDPLTVFDEFAQPFWDMFTDEPDFEPYTFIARVFPPEFAEPGTNCERASASLHLMEVDQAEALPDIERAYMLEETDPAAASLEWQRIVEGMRDGDGEVWEVIQ